MPLKSSRIAEIYIGLQDDHADPPLILLAEQMLIESLSPLQALALDHIRENGPISNTRLAGHLHVESHYVPRVLRVLAALGLVAKRGIQGGLFLWASTVYTDKTKKIRAHPCESVSKKEDKSP
jgi:DNA-binding MarR family transcriptional regulator